MRFALFTAAIVLAGAVGCGSVQEKPSYADLVVIYNAEAETLERLERKRADMVAEYEATLAPSPEEALQTLLGNLSEAGDEANVEGTDPGDELDQATDYLENAEARTAALLEAAREQAGKATDRATIESMYSEEFKARLAEVDAEIAEQQARVDKARAARDAAEPN